VAAVEEGRTIYDNIRKFVGYLLSANAGEIITMFGALMIGFKTPLLAIQILWVNLVTDGLPAVALGFEPSEPGVMKRKPRPPKESIFAHGVGVRVIWVGLWIGLCTIIGFAWALHRNGGELFDPADDALRTARTLAFGVLAVSQICLVAAMHAGDEPFYKMSLRRNPLLWIAALTTILLQLAVTYLPFAQDILNTSSLDLIELVVMLLLSASIAPAVEIEKWFHRRSEVM
jgi:P-type Ca2+ transporter type 2C